jgi:hypothetical protein
MRFKTGFAVGFGAGYVLGAKAGRARYEQIKRRWQQMSGSPALQWAAGRTRDMAGESARRGLTLMQQGVQKAGSAVKDRLDRDGESGIG